MAQILQRNGALPGQCKLRAARLAGDTGAYVPRRGTVTLSIYDITGRLVQTLANQAYEQGQYRVDFDGSRLPSGIYFARLQGRDFSKTQKLVLLK